MYKHYLNIVTALAGILALTVLFRYHSDFWIFVSVVVSVFLLIVCSGVVFLKLNYFLPAISRVQKPIVLLTFDDGPDDKLTPKILEILKAHKVAALFFVVGKKAKQSPELLQKIKNDGHIIGNHTQNHHPLFSLQSSAKVEQEIRECDKTIISILGETTIYFRPPVGYTNPRIARAIKKLGKKTIGWQVRSYDSVFKNSNSLKKRLIGKTKAGNIILLHDNLPQTAEMLDAYITEAKRNGIIFATKDVIKTIIQ